MAFLAEECGTFVLTKTLWINRPKIIGDVPGRWVLAVMSNFATTTAPDISFLRLPSVLDQTAMSRSSLYSLIRTGEFPAPVQLGPRTVGWLRSEVQTWATERVRVRDAA
jgi:prophage regulatory protein